MPGRSSPPPREELREAMVPAGVVRLELDDAAERLERVVVVVLLSAPAEGAACSVGSRP